MDKGALETLVAGVLAIMQLEFQQFCQFKLLKVLQIQIHDRVLDIPVARGEGAHSANCAAKRPDSTGAVLGSGCWRARCGATTGADGGSLGGRHS